MIKIENCEEKHLEDIYGLSVTVCLENGQGIYFNKDTIKNYINDSSKKGCYSKVATLNGVVVGYIFACQHPRMPVIQIEHVVVHSEVRNTPTFLRLLLGVKRWAKENEMELMLIVGMGLSKERAKSLGFDKEFIYYGKEL